METLVVTIKPGFMKQLQDDLQLKCVSASGGIRNQMITFNVDNAQILANAISAKDYVLDTEPTPIVWVTESSSEVKPQAKVESKQKEKSVLKKTQRKNVLTKDLLKESSVWYGKDKRVVEIVKATPKEVTYKYRDTGRGSTISTSKFLSRFEQ